MTEILTHNEYKKGHWMLDVWESRIQYHFRTL